MATKKPIAPKGLPDVSKVTEPRRTPRATPEMQAAHQRARELIELLQQSVQQLEQGSEESAARHADGINQLWFAAHRITEERAHIDALIHAVDDAAHFVASGWSLDEASQHALRFISARNPDLAGRLAGEIAKLRSAIEHWKTTKPRRGQPSQTEALHALVNAIGIQAPSEGTLRGYIAEVRARVRDAEESVGSRITQKTE